jgi:hypothetical protein
MKKLLGMAVVFAVALSSCKKDDEKVCDLNQTNLLGSYKITSIKYKANTSTPEVDVLATYDACDKDDLTVFNSNNTLSYVDAGTKCSPPTDGTGIWALSGSNLIIDGEIATVSSFNCSGMTITIPGTAAGELTTATLAKQ